MTLQNKQPAILVVDDEQDIRSLLSDILSEQGYEVTQAQDAETAQRCRQNNHFDLILLDIWMPDVDGLTLFQQWREQGDQTQVVFMSGHGTIDTAMEATRLGAAAYLEKPIGLSELLATVQKALAQLTRPVQADAHRGVWPAVKTPCMANVQQRLEHLVAERVPVLLQGAMGSGRSMAARFVHDVRFQSEADFYELSGLTLDVITLQEALQDQARSTTFYIRDLDVLAADCQSLVQQCLLDAPKSSNEQQWVASLNTEAMAFGAPWVTVPLPDLVSYQADLPELLQFFSEQWAVQTKLQPRRFSIAAQNHLRHHAWLAHASFKQLEQLVRQLLSQSTESQVTVKDIETVLDESAADALGPIKPDVLALPLREAREQFERRYLIEQLALCDGKVGRVADKIGVERTHLYRKLRSLGVALK